MREIMSLRCGDSCSYERSEAVCESILFRQPPHTAGPCQERQVIHLMLERRVDFASQDNHLPLMMPFLDMCVS